MPASRPLRFLTALLSLALLTSCIDRDQADRKLAEACAAGAGALLEDGAELTAPKTVTFAFDNIDAQKMRHVVLTAGTKDDPDTTAQYDCVFQEDFGLMGNAYNAALYRITAGDKTLGNVDGQIEGDLQDFMKLNDTVGRVLHQ